MDKVLVEENAAEEHLEREAGGEGETPREAPTPTADEPQLESHDSADEPVTEGKEEPEDTAPPSEDEGAQVPAAEDEELAVSPTAETEAERELTDQAAAQGYVAEPEEAGYESSDEYAAPVEETAPEAQITESVEATEDAETAELEEPRPEPETVEEAVAATYEPETEAATAEAAAEPVPAAVEAAAEPKPAKAEKKTKAKSKAQAIPATDEELFQPGKSWYVVHTYSGYEDKVRTNLEQRIKSMDAEDLVFRVVVPSVEEMEIRDGQRRTVPKKIFPGYVLVQMITLQEEEATADQAEMARFNKAWMVVRNSPGVTGFVGSGTAPTPLEREEVQAIMKQMRAEEPVVKVGFTTGQSVRVIDGPFADFVGVVDEINVEKGKVKVLVSMMGRETPVELDFLQVERL